MWALCSRQTVGLPVMFHRAQFVNSIIMPFWGNPWAQEQLSTERQDLQGSEHWTSRCASLMINNSIGIIHDSLTQSLDWTFWHILHPSTPVQLLCAPSWSFSRLDSGEQHHSFQSCSYCVLDVQRMNITPPLSLWALCYLLSPVAGSRLVLSILRP